MKPKNITNCRFEKNLSYVNPRSKNVPKKRPQGIDTEKNETENRSHAGRESIPEQHSLHKTQNISYVNPMSKSAQGIQHETGNHYGKAFGTQNISS